MRVLAASLVLVISGCGLVPGRSARCDLRPQTPQCTDWRNTLQPVFATQQALCMTLGATSAGGVFSEGQTCPTEELWGGCQTRAADGSLQTNWFYRSEKYKTREAAQAECAGAMTFVDPG